MAMRWTILMVLVVGCASGRSFEPAHETAQTCEYRRATTAAEASRARTTAISGSDDIRAANLQYEADMAAAQCAQLQAEEDRDEPRRGRGRAAAATALHGMGNAYREAGTTPAAAPRPINCATTTVGDMAFTSCN